MSTAAQAPVRPLRTRLTHAVRWAWFGLGILAIIATLWGIVDVCASNPNLFTRSRARGVGLLAALVFGLMRVGLRDRLWPDSSDLRVVFKLERIAVLWSILAGIAMGSTGGGLLFYYPPVAAMYTVILDQTTGCGPGGFGIWIARALGILGAMAWLLGLF